MTEHRITRTNSKNYIATCELSHEDGQPWTAGPIRMRINCSQRLREHLRTVHGIVPASIFTPKGNVAMKVPGAELPPAGEIGEQLGDYKNHLIVFTDARAGTRDTRHGNRDTIEANVWVYVDATWKNLGEVPVFWKGVIFQIKEAGGEPLGGVLQQGTLRNPNEWVLKAPTDKALKKALDEWTPDF